MKYPKISLLGILSLGLLFFACHNNNKKALFDAVSEAAQAGNPEAQYHLGMMLNNGVGVAKDPSKAYEWFQKASAAGNPLADYKIGCYLGGQYGEVVPINHDQSLRYKLVAANAGYSLAQIDVGNEFAKRENLKDAVHWWTLAAKQGDPQALYNLSVCCKDGIGVPRDLSFAYAYFKLAKLASEGRVSENAQAQLDELKRNMSLSDFEKAESFVIFWKAEATPLTKKASAGIDDAQKFLN